MLLVLLFNTICAVACYVLGEPKGYSGGVCAVAGFFGGLVAILIIALLPDRAEEAARAARRDSARDREIEALKNRIAQLESTQAPPAGQHQEAAPPEDLSSAEVASAASTAIFPARTEENIACPHCGRKQKGNRNACYSCGTPFRYENE